MAGAARRFWALSRVSAAPRGLWVWAFLAAHLLLPLTAAHAEDVEPILSLSASGGTGFMRGGRGGLMSGALAPIALEAQVLKTQPPRYLLGCALRLELEDAMAVAAIPRFQLRHPFGPVELRPGVGVPFYFAPRTMLGPEAGLGIKLKLGKDLGVLLNLSAAAFMIGNDVPHGSTVLMFHGFLGIELFI